MVGSQVSVSGECPPGGIPNIGIGQDQDAGPQATYPFFETLGRAMVRPDGRWALTGTVPAIVIGASKVLGGCFDRYGAATPIAPVAVTVTTPYSLQVTPGTTARLGDSLTVASVGGGCSAIADPDVYLWSASQPNAYTGPGEVRGSTGNSGPWSVTLTIPTTISPGRYYIVARCAYSRAFDATYQPVQVIIQS